MTLDISPADFPLLHPVLCFPNSVSGFLDVSQAPTRQKYPTPAAVKMAFGRDDLASSPHDHSLSAANGPPPPFEPYHGKEYYYNVKSVDDLPATDENNRPIRYYDINDPNDRPSINDQHRPIHYYNIIEPDKLPSIDGEYLSIENEGYPPIESDDTVSPHRPDGGPDTNSPRGHHESGQKSYASHRRQSSPYFDPIQLPGNRPHLPEASLAPIGFEDGPYTGNTTDQRSHLEVYDADHARYMRHLRAESPYFDPIVFDDERRNAREVHFAEIDTTDPYVGRSGFGSQ